MTRISVISLLSAFLLALPPAPAQQRPIAFTGARVIPARGPEIPSGTVVIQAGKITAVGPAANITIPTGAEVRQLSGKVIMPGLVDTHSHIGGVDGGDSSAPIQPEARVLDAINVRDARLQKAQAGGITTVNVMPGSGHLSSGQTLYLKLRDGRTVDDLLLPGENGQPRGGLKMANGTNPRKNPPFPGTRAKAAALIRQQFLAAQQYRDKLARAEDGKPPDRDLTLEPLVEALEGKRVIHFHSHRHDDILTVLRLQREFGFRTVLHHASDAGLVAQEIAQAKVPVSLILIDSPGGKIEAKDNTLSSAAALERAGARFAFHTDDGVTDSRFLLRMAALGVRAGASREKALEGVTLAAAGMLDLDDRTGSLEPGKDADLVILSGDPLSVYTKVLETWVEGQKVFDRSQSKDLLYSTGGYGAGHDQPPDTAAHGEH